MKELLSYRKSNLEERAPQVLIIKLAEQFCGHAVTNPDGTDLYSFSYYRIDEETGPTDFEEKYPQLHDTYDRVKIIIDHSRSILLPYNEMTGTPATPLLDSLYGYQGDSVTITENIPGWQLNNIYSVPADLLEWSRKKFPSADCLHRYSVSIQNLDAVAAEGKLLADFNNNEVTVIAGRQNRFLLARSFEYETPQDVLFYLMKICEHFSLSPKDVSLELSGLIERDSSLYKELYQYFMHTRFRDAGWGAAGDYPAHFFTSFNDVIRCVS